MNDLVRQYQMSYRPYPSKDQFGLQASTNAFYRTLPPGMVRWTHSPGVGLAGPIQSVSELAYAPSLNFAENYENPHAMAQLRSQPPTRPDYPV